MGGPLTESGFHRAIKDYVDPLNQKMESTKMLLEGPRGRPQEGMIIRMDRVERVVKWIVAGLGIIFTAMVVAGVNSYFQLLRILEASGSS